MTGKSSFLLIRNPLTKIETFKLKELLNLEKKKCKTKAVIKYEVVSDIKMIANLRDYFAIFTSWQL